MDHLQQTKQEFTRQAAGFAASAATTDSRSTQRFIEAAGASATQLALDVACGPGIVTASTGWERARSRRRSISRLKCWRGHISDAQKPVFEMLFSKKARQPIYYFLMTISISL